MTDRETGLKRQDGGLTAMRDLLVAICANLPEDQARAVADSFERFGEAGSYNDEPEVFREGYEELASLFTKLLDEPRGTFRPDGRNRESEVTG